MVKIWSQSDKKYPRYYKFDKISHIFLIQGRQFIGMKKQEPDF